MSLALIFEVVLLSIAYLLTFLFLLPSQIPDNHPFDFKGPRFLITKPWEKSANKAWRAYYAQVLQPFLEQKTFYAVSCFALFISWHNSISWSVSWENGLPIIYLFSQDINLYDINQIIIISALFSLLLMRPFWQVSLMAAYYLSSLLIKRLSFSKLKFTLVACCFLALANYALTVILFYLLNHYYSISHGMLFMPGFILLFALVLCFPTSRFSRQ